MKTKNIVITEETHFKLKEFCRKHLLKINQVADMILLKYLEKNNDNLQNKKFN